MVGYIQNTLHMRNTCYIIGDIIIESVQSVGVEFDCGQVFVRALSGSVVVIEPPVLAAQLLHVVVVRPAVHGAALVH